MKFGPVVIRPRNMLFIKYKSSNFLCIADKRLDGWGADFQSHLLFEINSDLSGFSSWCAETVPHRQIISGSCDLPVVLFYVDVRPSLLNRMICCHYALSKLSIWHLERPTSLPIPERNNSPLFTWTTWPRRALLTLEWLGILQKWYGQWNKAIT